MVEPPPGYKHSKPCWREWCPGDWSEATEKKGRRRDQGEKGRAKQARYFDEKIGSATPEPAEEGEVEEDQADWHLEGFPE
jgi:hypothetical protein